MILISLVTDVGLTHLKEMTRLEALNLSKNDITDEGLKYFHVVKSLENISLLDTNVTEAGVRELKYALPHLKVHGPSSSGG